eukprot:TRINITY_DN4188_c0_g1_i1.p1 TRINITY_DN4188_c0_g1~~TRINITY_DN4188_c0_g1_i1.p1  ORF type:complete len:268 (-),score=60.66 TRINITY_DN4188_c0_g1_i1:35-838(-)
MVSSSSFLLAFSALALSLLVLTVAGASQEAYDGRYRLIDTAAVRNGTVVNYLFRGNEPVRSGRFDYNWTVSNLRAGAALRNVTLPDQFYIIDFCLLEFEVEDIAAEKAYFEQHPEKGHFVSWPILGSPLPPLKVGKTIRKYMATKVDGIDNLPDTVTILTELLHTANQTLPVIVLIHCEAGKDRTGEVSASYYMSGLNPGWSFQQSLYYANKCVEGKRDISWFSSNALQWYCWRLYYQGQTDLKCAPDSNYVGDCYVPPPAILPKKM